MRYISLFIFLLFVLACQNKSKEDQRAVEEITDPELIYNSDIIRNPVSANAEPQDTINVAKLEFNSHSFDFGEVEEGEVVTHAYEFTNTGKVPLVITNGHSTCGCTVPEWPKEAIKPGGKGKIVVKFDSNGKAGPQAKPITIVANTYPSQTMLELVGLVNAKN
ncbi:MAG TPA: DUF1573 domain-containing protein [Haliscomenobacter sp.]|uniref:DUF1573 domain-containing protein n=1 Tax=Haliscomenobacter sp. TaxID=2717303 RepID=UPI002C31FD89|nr:DUF1573 domain-containing protein [Haliscomenobacter sp.]HOY18476.1 DUF1573 domain-containing protein [Haliscomenobacter sp.]HPH21141.1 DUF1573 domain-containing protein [Haliscomenobacter sp.]